MWELEGKRRQKGEEREGEEERGDKNRRMERNVPSQILNMDTPVQWA